MCVFFKVDFIAVASASQAAKPERLTLWVLFFLKMTVLDSIVQHSNLPETVAFFFFLLCRKRLGTALRRIVVNL